MRPGTKFASIVDAIAAMRATAKPLVLTRFAPATRGRLVIAVNAAAALLPTTPSVGENPDLRRDPDVTADVEIDYLFRHLVERGHARQVLSINGRLVELDVTRVEIEGDEAVYGFVSATPRRGQ